MAEFLVRLRGTADGIVDLAGNEWTTSNVAIDTSTTKFGDYSLKFNTGQMYTVMSPLVIPVGVDFTVAYWANAISNTGGAIPSGDVSGLYIAPWLDNGAIIDFGIWNSSGSAIFRANLAINVPTNTWVHLAMTRKDDIIRCFYNGELVYTYSSAINEDIGSGSSYFGLGGWGPTTSSSDMYRGYLDDFCLIKGKALWTEDFTPPTGYLDMSFYAYLSNNNLYTGTSLTNLTNNWSGLTNAEKEALVPSFSIEIPSIQDLASISPFRVLTDNASSVNVKVTGQPKTQTITPTSLINTGALSTVQSINITNTITDVTVKFAITTDLTTYKVYDATNSTWKISTNIEEDGMSIAQINALTPEILALLDVSNGIAFKQCFIATSENASVELSEISAVVDIDGSWTQSVHGTDYNVDYPNKTTMSVRLLTNGDYIINYPISSNS